MVAQYIYDSLLERPVLWQLFRDIVEGSAGEAESGGELPFRLLLPFDQLFFWDRDILRVSSPTRARSSSFRRLSFTSSPIVGLPFTPFPSQLYTVAGFRPCSFAAWETGVPSSLIRFNICSFISGAMRYVFFMTQGYIALDLCV